MISATFIVDTATLDEEFHQLDARIIQAAKETVGYIGEEAWADPKTGRTCTVYYWEGMEGLQQLMRNVDHCQAQAKSHRWLQGYRVVISEVLATYGTDNYPHPLEGCDFGKTDLGKYMKDNGSK